jgi:hypothetical protein
MSISAGKQPATAQSIASHNGENPYATPQAMAVDLKPECRRTNFQLQRLGFTLRAHALLTIVAIAVFATAWALTDGPWPEVGAWLFLGLVFIFPALALTTVLLVFEVFSIPAAILVFASMFLPLTWPVTFIGIHWWGRSILKAHSMQLGVLKGPQYVAQIAEQST